MTDSYMNRFDRRRRRMTGWIRFVIMTLAGGVLFFGFAHRGAAYAVWGLGALLLSGLLFSPFILRWFDKTGNLLGVTIAAGFTWLLLTPIYLIVFGCGRLVLKLRGADPLRRRLDRDCESYWEPYLRPVIHERYHRQY